MNPGIVYIEPENNPFYPLPPDYLSLTEDGQRMARCNAISQWRLPLPPLKKGGALVACLQYFDRYYLQDDPDENFYPMFYKKDFVPSPQFHYDIVSGWATEPLSLSVCPRGAAKSTLAEKASILELVTHPGYEIVYATNNHDNAKRRGFNIRYQLYENARIHDDWAPIYGRLKPNRGDLSTGVEHFFISNLSSVRMCSAQSGLRGGRPHVFYLDDPENDERASTSMQLIRAYMERLLFGVIAPMIMQPGCSIRWLATFVSKRHYAFSAMDVSTGPDGIARAKDPRFNHWYRMLVKAAYEDIAGNKISCWKEMWPATIAEKKSDPKLSKRVSLEEIEARIGRHRFLTEYMGQPGESDTSFFQLDPLKHGYELEDVDDQTQTNPRGSNTKVCYYHGGKRVRTPLCELLAGARMVIPCDTSYTATSTSDYKACGLFILTSDNLLFLLDLWGKQCHEDLLIKQAFNMADRWRCPLIKPETVKQSYSLYQSMLHIVQTRANDALGTSFLPSVRPLKPPGTLDKTSKIGALSFRFEHGLIKLPIFQRGLFPYNQLFEQIDGFNPDADAGGLQHDDFLDLIAMAQMCFQGKPRAGLEDVPQLMSPVERIRRGELEDEVGLPTMHGVDLQSLTIKEVLEMVALCSGEKGNKRGTRI